MERAAELIGRAVILDPNDAESRYDLALVFQSAGRLDEACASYREAIRLDPRRFDSYNNLGAILQSTGRFDEAIDAFQTACAIEPRNAMVSSNLGSALFKAGRFEAAISACSTAVRLDPTSAEARNHLGLALQGAGRAVEAAAAHRDAVRLAPKNADFHFHLGNALRAQGDFDAAIGVYETVLRLQPEHAEAHNSYGIALQKAGRIACFSRATSLQPHSVSAWCNYGGALQAKDRFDEAIAACQEALRIDPTHAPSANKLGTALRLRGRLSEAMDAFRRAVDLDPELPEAQHNLGNAHRDQGEPDLALGCYRKAVALDPREPTYHSALAYALCFHPDYDAKALLDEHLRWDARHAQPLKSNARTFVNEATLDRPLRIGYVSPNFRDHVVGRNILPLLREHDRADFETYCYADVSKPDGFTEQFRALCGQWRDIRLVSDDQVAEMVRSDRIDILVDLTLHMAGSRLLVFARKPAPIQVTFAGYPGGTGLETMDYRLTDPWLDPHGVSDGDYREESIRLPHSFGCGQKSCGKWNDRACCSWPRRDIRATGRWRFSGPRASMQRG
jgi:predicted O-linked N-acetylglucosamine transferase (SPINDLY family)